MFVHRQSHFRQLAGLLIDTGLCAGAAAQESPLGWHRRMDRLEADIALAEEMRAIKRLQRIYGYYLDKNLWNDLADLFAAGGSMELAQRGRYVGRERVRGFLFNVFNELPFHYDNPVTGRPSHSAELIHRMNARSFDGCMPPEIAEQLRAIGPQIDPPATSAIYAPLHAAASQPPLKPVRDVRYGRHERNVLDVFSPGSAGDSRPVVVFVHGGGFTRGAKHTPGSPFYDNVMRWAAAQGYVGVNVNYRLAPEHQWPSGIEDLGGVVEWIAANIGEFGGDSDSVVLWGHSAGAAHVADYLAERVRDGRDDGVAAAVLLSGFYDLGSEVSAWEAYYGSDVRQYARRSSLPGLLETDTPLMVVDAELDPPHFREQAAGLTEALAAAGKPLRRLHLAGHSHISEGYAVGTSDRSLSDPVRRFIDETLAEATR